MNYSVAMTEDIHREALAHLLRDDGQEDLCFALWRPSRGSRRYSALVQSLVLPLEGERQVHGNASFNPAYFERATRLAVEAGAGLVFMHSHVGPGWQGMSPDDVETEVGRAASAKGATGLPLVGMTLGTDATWSARFWEKQAPKTYVRRWCETVRVVGDRLEVSFNENLLRPPRMGEELRRTVSAWGPRAQADLARLRVGVIGGGSVGSIVGETLARMGVGKVLLLDFDALKSLNRDRTLHATRSNANIGKAKVQVLAEALKESATAEPFMVDPLEWSIVEEAGFSAALDCDILFSCVDRPWPRAVLNLIAYAHLIPVVDGGLRLVAKKDGTGLKHADWRAHTAGPSHRCLECLGQFDPAMVSLERDGYLDDPAYIAGLPEGHPAKKNENVFGFSLHVSAMEMLQFLKLVIPDPGLANVGAQHYHYVTAELESDKRVCDNNCLYPTMTAQGDHLELKFIGRHVAAESARSARSIRTPRRHRAGVVVRRLLGGLTFLAERLGLSGRKPPSAVVGKLAFEQSLEEGA